MKRICLVSTICLAGPTTACGGVGNIGTTGSGSGPGSGTGGGTGSGPGSGSPTASPGCDNAIIWGGNTNGISSSGASAFLPTGSMNQPRAGHTATLLPDGTVLVVDGGQLDIDDLLVSFPSAEIFDPSQGKFSTVGTPCVAREFHTATLLMNGKVLITGGTQFNGYPTWLPSTPTAELYDPASRSFTNTGSMQASPHSTYRDFAGGWSSSNCRRLNKCRSAGQYGNLRSCGGVVRRRRKHGFSANRSYRNHAAIWKSTDRRRRKR